MNELRKRIAAFRLAGKGISHLIRHESHFRYHLGVVVLVCSAGWVYSISAGEWIAIVLCFGIVLTTEALNTAIERWTDLVEKKRFPLAGLVKDIAAAAVLISAMMALIAGCIIFIPKIF